MNLGGRVGLLLSILLTYQFLASCEKCENPCDQECENYDPCCGKTPANASFKIYEVLGADKKNQENFELLDLATDTIVYTNFAYFRAEFEADYYEWTVGKDPRVWNSRDFTLRFGEPFYDPIKVTLKVSNLDEGSCFPNLSDTAIFTRTLCTAPPEDSKVLGKYQGTLGQQPSLSNFFELTSITNQFSERSYAIAGIAPHCATNGFENGDLNLFIGYRTFYLSTEGTKIGCCYGLSASGVVNSSNKLAMNLSYYSFNSSDSCSWDIFNDQYITDTFSGIKI